MLQTGSVLVLLLLPLSISVPSAQVQPLKAAFGISGCGTNSVRSFIIFPKISVQCNGRCGLSCPHYLYSSCINMSGLVQSR